MQDAQGISRNVPPSLLEKAFFRSWDSIDIYSSELSTSVEKMISQPGAKPWNDVDHMGPDLLQPVADVLQMALDDSPIMQSGFPRAAAIKTLRAISSTKYHVLPKSLALRNVTKGNIINYGGFAEVFQGMYGHKEVCIKVLRIKGSNAENNLETVIRRFRHEALLWRQLHHPRILPLLGIIEDHRIAARRFHTFGLVSPWMSNGNVNEFLKTDGPHDRFRMALEITEGIEYLHAHDPQIVHADIRGENILVTDDGTCCLADFGISMVIETREPTLSRSGKGAPYWMSPEVWLQNDAHIPARDIYAFGCTVIEIYSGTHPFPDIPNSQYVVDEVVYRRQKPPRPRELHEEKLWAVVDSCLEHEAEFRPTATDVLGRLRALACVQ